MASQNRLTAADATPTEEAAELIDDSQLRSALAIPNDVIGLIFFEFLDLADLENLLITCKTWGNYIHEKMKPIKGKIFFIGPSGSGKSTLISLIFKKSLEASRYPLRGIRLDVKEKIPRISIGHGGMAGTFEPASVLDFNHGAILIDCPGFGDPRGRESNFENAVAIHKHLKGKLKVIIVVAESFITYPGDSRFINQLNQLSEIFTNETQAQALFSLVVNMQRECEVVEFIELYYIKNNQPYLLPKAKKLLEGILKSGRVVSLAHANQNGLYLLPKELEDLLAKGDLVFSPATTEPVRESINQNRWSSKKEY